MVENVLISELKRLNVVKLKLVSLSLYWLVNMTIKIGHDLSQIHENLLFHG